MAYIVVPFTLNAEDLVSEALDRLAENWPGWVPNDGDMEVIQLETLAPIAQDVAEAAATVPDAIFRSYGTDLLDEAYLEGTPAIGTARFTAVDTTGYTTSASVEFAVQDMAFTTDAPLVIAPGSSTVDVPITAMEPGALGNGLWGPGDMLAPLSWVSLVEITSPSFGGSDPETDAEYQERLANKLLLQATTLVTGRDYELMALAQQGIGRAVAIVSQARQVTVAVADTEGELVEQTIKDELAAIYQQYRQVNTTFSIIDPTYTTINATWQLVAIPGFDPETVNDQASSAVEAWLNPAGWGVPRGSPVSVGSSGGWLNETIVRYSELVRVLSVGGVRYVQAATLNGSNVDVPVTGTAPLTRPGTLTGTTVAST